ncbi:hypothetical protein BLNAU_9080 [Blattamonas nauphoetae]|uniref:Uncharacterized protein n=1 Tax=Blattamonas nauphoetae TaxID=2049346 RepID=A0ABQ9XWQ7_9EUKA|nr:hypothetical protein BLNAU_9080 [Blattamonas nauphoetae]
MEFLVDSCQPSQTPSDEIQIVLTRPTPLLISAIDEMSSRFSISDLFRYLSTPPDFTDTDDKDSSARTDLATDVLFLSLLSIVSDEAFHKPARHLLARMFEMSEGELERLLLEREVRRGDLEMEWLGEGRTKEDTLSFAEGVWMLLGRRETEEERDEETNEADKDEKNEEETEQETETESDEMEQEPESVEYPRTVRNEPFDKPISIPTVFLHRVACLLISALFSSVSDCLPSNHKPTASTNTTHNNHDSGEIRMSEPKDHQMSESHLFRICLKLTGWLLTTFKMWQSGCVFTKTVRMDVESAMSLVFLLLPHADLDSQCFLVSLLRHFLHFIEMAPRVITPDLVRKVALFFAHLGPSLPHKLVRSVEHGVRWMMAGRSHSQWGPEGEEAAELCRPILGDLMNRLESDVEGRREIAAQIWVIASSNDHHLLESSCPIVPLVSVLSETADDYEAFFILRACTKTIAETSLFHQLNSHYLQHSSTILRFGKRMDSPLVVFEAWRLLLQLTYVALDLCGHQDKERTVIVRRAEEIAVEFGETVSRVLQMRRDPNHSFGREADVNTHLHFLHFGLDLVQGWFKHIDFSPLHLSLLPALQPLQRFIGRIGNPLWISVRSLNKDWMSTFPHLSPFSFISPSLAFPTEQSVVDHILKNRVVTAESIIRSCLDVDAPDQSETEPFTLRTTDSFFNPLRVRLALECAIHIPRLLYNLVPFFRAKHALFEQGKDQKRIIELLQRMSKVFFALKLDLLVTRPYSVGPLSHVDIGLIRWALTDWNRRDALPPTNQKVWSPSETGLSFSENLQFAAMWMLNGMVEFPFSSPTKRDSWSLPLLWKLMLNSILFHPPFHHSIAQTAVQLRVCLSEEGLEDVVGAMECLIDKSFGIKFGLNNHLPAFEDDDDGLNDPDWDALFT